MTALRQAMLGLVRQYADVQQEAPQRQLASSRQICHTYTLVPTFPNSQDLSKIYGTLWMIALLSGGPTCRTFPQALHCGVYFAECNVFVCAGFLSQIGLAESPTTPVKPKPPASVLLAGTDQFILVLRHGVRLSSVSSTYNCRSGKVQSLTTIS